MPKNIPKETGQRLKSLIVSRYRTVEVFAHENNIDKGWLSRVLRGEIDPGFSKVVHIAEALEVTLDDVFPMKKSK